MWLRRGPFLFIETLVLVTWWWKKELCALAFASWLWLCPTRCHCVPAALAAEHTRSGALLLAADWHRFWNLCRCLQAAVHLPNGIPGLLFASELFHFLFPCVWLREDEVETELILVINLFFEACILQQWQLGVIIRRCLHGMDRQKTGVGIPKRLHGLLLRPPPRKVDMWPPNWFQDYLVLLLF